jgi:hypothetical protein
MTHVEPKSRLGWDGARLQQEGSAQQEDSWIEPPREKRLPNMPAARWRR